METLKIFIALLIVLAAVFAVGKIVRHYIPARPAATRPELDSRNATRTRFDIFFMVSAVFFGMTIRGLGLAPSLGGAILLFTLGGGSLPKAFASSVIITTLVIAFFWWRGIDVQIVGPWLQFG